MKKLEHLPNEWYIKDSDNVTKWFVENYQGGNPRGFAVSSNIQNYFYLYINNNTEYYEWVIDIKKYQNVIEITEDQLFNKTTIKKDNIKRLCEILKYIKQNA